MQSIMIRPFTEEDLEVIWRLGFFEAAPAWKEWDAPYFVDDYEAYETFEAFLDSPLIHFFLHPNRQCICVDDQPVGMVGRYWADRQTLWLNIGITIYDPHSWGGGIGTYALALWIDDTFAAFPDLEHIGLTSWSGNKRMMRVAEKLSMQKEAQIRKVRYWQGVYYDSVSYGVLREEWGERAFLLP